MDLTATLEQTQTSNTISKSKERNSSIELLRIISMLFIVAHHFAIHSGFELSSEFTLNNVWIKLLSLGGKLGVNVFVLISSYFSINSKFKPQKIIKIVLQVTFYSIVCFLVLVCNQMVFLTENLTFGTALLKAILCIPFNEYWFATTYFLLFILTPYLNKFIKSIDEKTHRNLIITLIVVWSVFPTFINAQFNFNNLGWFITLHFIATYLNLYSKKVSNNRGVLLLIILINSILIVIFSINSTALLNRFNMANSLFVLISSIATFLIFKNIKFNNKIINVIASATFGVYLIHDNQYFRPYLWKVICKNTDYLYSSNLIPHSILCILTVFIVCSLVELIRINVLEKSIFKVFDYLKLKLKK